MMMLPTEILALLTSFAPLFTQPSWTCAQSLLVGALLCQGPRRVSTVLRVLGLAQEKRFEKYHRVLNRARWSSLQASRILLGLLVQLLPDSHPLLVVVDDAIERRGGKRITARGCYRDACRSTESNVITCFGLKWICFTLLVPLPWNERVWALPFMTLLAPSEAANKARHRPHKTSVDWTCLAVRLISRWLSRAWILIGDGGFACLHLAWICAAHHVTLISRLRLDAALYEFPLTPGPGKAGRPREKGARALSLAQRLSHIASHDWQVVKLAWYTGQMKTLHLQSGAHLWYTAGQKPLPIRWVIALDPVTEQAQAFFSTALDLSPEGIIRYAILRWNIEVTFWEARAHLGMETQRQWSDKAIARTTPILLSLYSITCLLALELKKTRALTLLSTAWYHKTTQATFSDILAFVRRAIWTSYYFAGSTQEGDNMKINPQQRDTLLDLLTWAT